MSCTDQWVLDKYKEEMLAKEEQVVDNHRNELNQLRTQILTATLAEKEEELLRLTNPALQDAWDKYQIVLKMVK